MSPALDPRALLAARRGAGFWLRRVRHQAGTVRVMHALNRPADLLAPAERAFQRAVGSALRRGATLEDVAAAAGLTDPPATLGVADVEGELGHRLDRGQVPA